MRRLSSLKPRFGTFPFLHDALPQRGATLSNFTSRTYLAISTGIWSSFFGSVFQPRTHLETFWQERGFNHPTAAVQVSEKIPSKSGAWAEPLELMQLAGPMLCLPASWSTGCLKDAYV